MDGGKVPINPYTEKEIRNSILNKVKPEIKKGRAKHDKGNIYIDEKLVSKVKIPNNHDRTMKEKKSQYIARDLQLEDNEFNELIACPLTGPKYYDLLRQRCTQI